MDLKKELDDRLSAALTAAGAPEGSAALVGRAARPEFGDYQANGVMPAAKKLKTNPRRLAEQVAAAADLADLAESVEVAGPGFINICLRNDWLAARLADMAADPDRLGVPPAEPRQTVVVDYSAPNLAKEMHVGHLRSTIIGDALVRVLEHLGHKVIRQNHVGDWGTQFGMLATYYIWNFASRDRQFDDLSDLEETYRRAKALFDDNPEFADASRANVVKLQSGDQTTREAWREYTEISLRHCHGVYERLGVNLAPDDIRGESAYNDDLPHVVEDLRSAGLLTESQGAKCVFLDEFKGKDGEPLPVIVQKSDEGYLYATTDLAAMRYRVRELGADRVLYVVDARQSLHFRQVFAVARKADFVPDEVSLEHVAFGTMMGADGRPFKTREGGTVKLTDLLDQAVERARALVDAKSPDLPAQKRAEVAEAVGIGAVKYADLAQNRTSDYVFSWDKMLSLEGNTAPYMQYAYARVRSIFRRGDLRPGEAAGEVLVAEPAERALAVKLLQFPETVAAVAADCLPNVLCVYLFELAGAFMGFYETCPVLKAPADARAGRLTLCDLTAQVIHTGLDLLGIKTVERM